MNEQQQSSNNGGSASDPVTAVVNFAKEGLSLIRDAVAKDLYQLGVINQKIQGDVGYARNLDESSRADASLSLASSQNVQYILIAGILVIAGVSILRK
jgi:hypothetical protein